MSPTVPPLEKPPSYSLLDSQFLRQLDRVRLSPKVALTAREMGDVPSVRRGQSVEFADYREYQPGDDVRAIDWTLLARLDRLFVRLFRAEESLHLELLVDSSTSMHFGVPTKMHYATQLAAALGYIALRHGDRVSASIFNDRPHQQFANSRGQHAVSSLLAFLAQEPQPGGTDLTLSLSPLALRTQTAGVSVLISDLLDPVGYQTAIDGLVRTGRQVAVLHLLSPEELRPEMNGDFAFIDAETETTVEISVDADTIILYQEVLERWIAELRSFCHSRRAAYFQVDTSTSVPDLVLRHLRQGGLLA